MVSASCSWACVAQKARGFASPIAKWSHMNCRLRGELISRVTLSINSRNSFNTKGKAGSGMSLLA
eukprot:4402464-Prymnesium_polylepis.1